MAPGTEQASHLRRALAVREALRSLLVANNGGVMDADAPAILEAAARASKLELHLTAQGRAELVPAASGTTGALGALLAIVAEAMAAGTWNRLKACRAETCRWAFYDHSPNRSRIWCSMAVCGRRQRAGVGQARRASL
jgi:predicted RNA-binding Zn ribbon-like protein